MGLRSFSVTTQSAADAEATERVTRQAQDFAERIAHTIRSTLPGDPVIAALREPTGRVQITAVEVDTNGNPTSVPTEMPLFIAKEKVARWRLSMSMQLDWTNKFLKTRASALALTSEYESAPLARLEYLSTTHTAPVSHWQFHAERGAFSHLLARASSNSRYVTGRPHSLSTLHFPVGGERYRPSIEDFIEFLIRECGVDPQPGWEAAVQEGREIWRRMQTRTVVRDLQAEAAQTLKDLGWTVTAPDDFDEGAPPNAMLKW
ncbi:hypothetical protein OD997_06220 [Microbacterium sp. CGR1]